MNGLLEVMIYVTWIVHEMIHENLDLTTNGLKIVNEGLLLNACSGTSREKVICEKRFNNGTIHMSRLPYLFKSEILLITPKIGNDSEKERK